MQEEVIDIVDVAPTIAKYLKRVDIPFNSYGIARNHYGINSGEEMKGNSDNTLEEMNVLSKIMRQNLVQLCQKLKSKGRTYSVCESDNLARIMANRPKTSSSSKVEFESDMQILKQMVSDIKSFLLQGQTKFPIWAVLLPSLLGVWTFFKWITKEVNSQVTEEDFESTEEGLNYNLTTFNPQLVKEADSETDRNRLFLVVLFLCTVCTFCWIGIFISSELNRFSLQGYGYLVMEIVITLVLVIFWTNGRYKVIGFEMINLLNYAIINFDILPLSRGMETEDSQKVAWSLLMFAVRSSSLFLSAYALMKVWKITCKFERSVDHNLTVDISINSILMNSQRQKYVRGDVIIILIHLDIALFLVTRHVPLLHIFGVHSLVLGLALLIVIFVVSSVGKLISLMKKHCVRGSTEQSYNK